MTGWRARLAALRAGGPTAADAGEGADGSAAVSTKGANDIDDAIGEGVGAVEETCALVRRAAGQAAVAPTVLDSDLAVERAGTALAQEAVARGDFGRPLPKAGHRAALAGYLAAGLQRPPPGAWCTCCGRHHRSGGRWWREAEAPQGWRCRTCHPPDHLPADAVREVRT